MSTTYEKFEGEAGTDLYGEMEALIRKNPWAWQAVFAVLGLAGGVIAPVLGAAADVVTWFVHSQSVNSRLHVVSIIACALTLPLLILGAFGLDLLQKKSAKPSTPPETPREESTAALQDTGDGLRRTCASVVMFALLLGLAATTRAQQTVFNVPTTDVLPTGKVYFELDIGAKPVEPKFSSFVPRVVIGAGRNVEVGVNITGNIQPGPDATTLVPAIKWKVYNGKDNGWAIVIGNNLFIPVRNRSYKLGTFAYVMTQKTFKPGTRIGFGGNFFSKNVVAPNANRAGGQFTFEQPITRKLNFNADWYTGKHASGYVTTGFAYKATAKLTGVGAYSIGNGNAADGNHFLYFELGYNFN